MNRAAAYDKRRGVSSATGNRTSMTGMAGRTTNHTANRLAFSCASSSSSSVVQTNRYTYDAAGRLTNQVVGTGTRRFSYDFRGQMRSLTDTNSTAYAYEFDGDGNRRKETIAGTTRKFIYDGPNVLMELNNANGIEALYVQGPGIDQPIEKISCVGGAADGRFVYHTDALGSVAAITDELQATVRTYTYEAFGKLRATTGTGPVDGNRFTYTGREPLGDSGALYYYRWRVLDPNVGRFTSEDPLGFVDGVNLELYAKNNPIRMRDPSGLWAGASGGFICDGLLLKAAKWLCKCVGIAKAHIVGAVCTVCWTNCKYWCTTETLENNWTDAENAACNFDCDLRREKCIKSMCNLDFN